MGEYSSDNNGYRYLLTVIDTFSKFAWALPVKTKSGVEITKTMNQILKTFSYTFTNRKEFYSNNFKI
jgi:hypothetical protein